MIAKKLTALAIAGTWVAPLDPYASDPLNSLTPPAAGHWFGTDQLGRDAVLTAFTPINQIKLMEQRLELWAKVRAVNFFAIMLRLSFRYGVR